MSAYRNKLEKIPEFVIEWFKREAKTKNSIRIDIEDYHDVELTHLKHRYGLSFAYDLYFHGLNGYKLSIEEYLLKTFNYARGNLKILANGVPLDEIKPLNLPAPLETPQEIDLSST